MHYERIAPWADHEGALNPVHIRDDITELVRWMSPRAERALLEHGPLPELFAPAFERYAQWLARRI